MELIGSRALLFTDLEGSTALLKQLGKGYTDVLELHHRILRSSIASRGGVSVMSEGDAFVAMFQSADAAADAALTAQRGLLTADWPNGSDVRVRMGIHVGEIGRSEAGLIGLPLHEAARISSAAHGGQILISLPAANTLTASGWFINDRELTHLGEFMLKDIGRTPLLQLSVRDLPSRFPPPRGVRSSPTNLPRNTTDLVGRAEEISSLEELVSGCRLVTLLGSGGVGKTRLALAVAERLLDRFDRAVWVAELASAERGADVSEIVARSIRAPEGPSPLDSVVSSIGDLPALIILDNCEHLLAPCAVAVARLLGDCPAIHIVVTSQEPLRLAGEARWRVPSLELADAVTLFRSRMALMMPGADPSDRESEAIDRICADLGGIPLAIELAAARTSSMSVFEIEERLTDRFRLLRADTRGALARHQTIRAAVDWSFGLLTPAESALAARLSVFRGGIDIEGAEVVCSIPPVTPDEVDNLVESLAAKSLVSTERHDERTRIRFQETIRLFASERLTTSPEHEEVRERHAQYFAGVMHEAAQGWRGPRRAEWLRRCRQDSANFGEACDWLEVNDPDGAATLVCDSRLWLAAADDQGWLDRLARLTDRDDIVPEKRVALAALRAMLAEAYGREGADVAARHAERARVGIESVRDPMERLIVLADTSLGLRSSDPSGAVELGERAVTEARALGDQDALAYGLYDLILLRPEDHPETRRLRTELLGFLATGGDQWWGITPLVDEALDAHQHGRWDEALEYLRQAEVILATNDQNDRAFTDEAVTFTVWSSLIRAETGDAASATVLCEDTLMRLGNQAPSQRIVVSSTYGHALLLAGRFDAARIALNTALQRADGWRYLVYGLAVAGLASLEVAEGRPATASAQLHRMTKEPERQGWFRARCHDVAAAAAMIEGRRDDAVVHLDSADVLYTEGGYVVPPALRLRYEELRSQVRGSIP